MDGASFLTLVYVCLQLMAVFFLVVMFPCALYTWLVSLFTFPCHCDKFLPVCHDISLQVLCTLYSSCLHNQTSISAVIPPCNHFLKPGLVPELWQSSSQAWTHSSTTYNINISLSFTSVCDHLLDCLHEGNRK